MVQAMVSGGGGDTLAQCARSRTRPELSLQSTARVWLPCTTLQESVGPGTAEQAPQGPTDHVATASAQGNRLHGRDVGGAASTLAHTVSGKACAVPSEYSTMHFGVGRVELPRLAGSPGSRTHGMEQADQSSEASQKVAGHGVVPWHSTAASGLGSPAHQESPTMVTAAVVEEVEVHHTARARYPVVPTPHGAVQLDQRPVYVRDGGGAWGDASAE